MRLSSTRKLVTTTIALIAPGLSSSVLAEEVVAASRTVDGITIEAQPLAGALRDFSEKSGLQVAYVATLSKNKVSKGVREADTPAVALTAILDNTGLEYQFVNDGTVAIGASVSPNGASQTSNSPPVASPVVMAQVAQQQELPERSERSDTPRLEEIIVTGRKRGAEALQDVPVPITAFDATRLENMGVANFEDFAYHVPGLTFSDTGPGEKRIFIRGIQSAGEQQVAVYLDEVPLPGVQGSSSDSARFTPDFKLYDMERVEVLRGPQGTTFGANSQTGTVRLVTNKPDLAAFEADVRGEFSATSGASEMNWNVFGMANVPLVEDTLGLRFVAYSAETAGYIDNVRLNVNDTNSTDTLGGRAMLRWRPNDALTIDGMLWHEKREVNASFEYMPFDTFGVRNDPNDIGRRDFTGELTHLFFFETGRFNNGSFSRTFRPDRQTVASITAELALPWATLTAAGTYYERFLERWTTGGFALPFLGVGPEGELCGGGNPCIRGDLWPNGGARPNPVEQWHGELRLNSTDPGPWSWLVGAFYRQRDTSWFNSNFVADEEGFSLAPIRPPLEPPIVAQTEPGDGIPGCNPCVFSRFASKDVDEVAVFGELNYALTDRLEFSVGLRWFELEQSDFGQQLFPFAAFPPSPDAAEPDIVSAKEDQLIRKIQLNYNVADDVMFYAIASEGFRLGGTNNQGVVAIPELFESDDVWNYEGGLKTSWFGDRLIANASVFHLEWDNMQVQGTDQTGQFSFITNAGAAEVTGVEFEAFARPSPRWDLSVGMTWLPKKELTEDQKTTVQLLDGTEIEVGAPGLAGDEIPRVPEFQANLSIQHEFPLRVLDQWIGWVRGDASYRGSSRTELRPFEEGNRFDRPQDSYSIVNFRLGFVNEELGTSIEIFAQNIADTQGDAYIVGGNRDPTIKVTNRPRTIGVALRKSF